MLDSKEQNLDFNQIESDSNVSKVGRIRRFAPQVRIYFNELKAHLLITIAMI